jgi:hypothetical protein
LRRRLPPEHQGHHGLPGQDTEKRCLCVVPGDPVSAGDIAAAMPAGLSGSIMIFHEIEDLRGTVAGLIRQRVGVFAHAICGGPDGSGDVRYLFNHWRLFTAPVIAAVGVALTGCLPGVGFLVLDGDSDSFESFVASRQAVIWSSMLIDWTNGDGVGSFEEDLEEYVDRTMIFGDPLWFISHLDDLPRAADEERAGMNVYRREALRASLYARLDRPNPLADR